jgi:hypothetical protein
MAFRDDELLEFDPSRMPDFDRLKALEALEEHGEVFRAQLVAARWIDGWRRRLEAHRGGPTSSADFDDGVDFALREIVAHLRLGDFLPGGRLYEDEVTGRSD